MRLGARVSLFILVAAVAPLLLLAVASGSVASRQLGQTVARSQLELAQYVGVSVGRVIGDVDRVIRAQMANFRLGDAEDDVRTGFVIATYRLFPELSIASLLGPAGEELVPPVYRRAEDTEWVEEHEAIVPARVARFRAALPDRAGPGGSAMGRPVIPAGERAAVIPMVFTSPYGDGLAIAVELSLSTVQRRMDASVGGGRSILLMSLDGEVLAAAGPTPAVEPARFRPLLDTPGSNVEFTEDEVVAATARVPGLPWSVVVTEPASVVRAAQDGLIRPTAYIGAVAAIFSLTAGWLLSRSLTVPLRKLYDATKALGRGNLRRRVEVEGRDEVAEVGRAFNQMADALQETTQQIEEKNEEIRAFNRELQARVEKRTAQLREAQARLVQSGQLAAVAEMSAGLAHELNNPLAGVLGMVQLVAARRCGTPDEALLRTAEEQALRCKEIVATLLRFAEGPADRLGDERQLIDLDQCLTDVLELAAPALRQRSVTVERTPSPTPLKVRGNAAQLGRALGQMLTAMKSLAEPGTSIRIEGRVETSMAIMVFTVPRLVTNQDDWRAAGMGFWVARQVLGAHQFTLEESTPGAGVWTVSGPLAGD